MSRFATIAGTFFGWTIVAAVADAQVLIDDFTSHNPDPHVVSFMGTNDMNSTQTGLSVLGGSRNIRLNSMAPAFETSTAGATATLFATPRFSASFPSGTTSGFATLTYDNNGAGLGGVNLVEAPFAGLNNAFIEIQVISADIGVVLTVEIEDTAGNIATDQVTLAAGQATTEPFGFFANAANTDFTSVDRVSAQLSNAINPEFDASLRFISVGSIVPEPNSLAVFGVAFVALGGYFVSRRRKGHKNSQT